MKNIEENLNELGKILEKMANASLDEAIALYKSGIQLAEASAEILTKYENEVMILRKTGEGLFELKRK